MNLEESVSSEIENNIESLLTAVDRLAPSWKGKQDDLQFLKTFIHSDNFKLLLTLHDKLNETTSTQPSTASPCNILTLSHMVSYDLEQNPSHETQELYDLLTSTHVHSVVMTYDKVFNNDYPPMVNSPEKLKEHEEEEPLLIIRVDKGHEPLGATVKSDVVGNILISRVIHGTVADRCGLLKPGDVIHEINGESVRGKTIDEVADKMQTLTGTIVFKLSPSQQNYRPQRKNKSTAYMKALFSYDPTEDSQLPCSEAGLAFNKGDILEIVNNDDPHWWQASLVGETPTKTGLIPSSHMRERYEYSQAFNKLQRQGQHRRKSSKGVEYSPLDYEEHGGHELSTYEEVIKIEALKLHPRPIVLLAPKCPPFSIADLKSKLIRSNSNRFGGAITHTSRPRRQNEEDGQHYYFIDGDEMLRKIQSNQFIEYGKLNGHYYGLSINAVRSTMVSGKICLLTLVPRVLKLVHQSAEIKPYVVFFVPPKGEKLRQAWIENGLVQEGNLLDVLQQTEEMESRYGQYFDQIIEYESVDQAFIEVQRTAERLLTEPQWVPAIWTI